MRLLLIRGLCVGALALAAVPARAQTPAGCKTSISDNRSRIGENHWSFVGGVEFDCGDSKLYADEVEIFLNEDRLVATGNVVLAQPQSRISSDRADFNTRTRLGTFYNATGFTTMQSQLQRPRPGQVAPPPRTGEDSTVYFFGETIEKLGPKKFQITRGGFTTCVQPTPRWDMTANSLVVNVDHYTVLKNAILTVKGVPMLYIPFIYYPTKKEDRATGILLPTYGTSTLRGQSLHNAFFWAINRSQDATFTHDWFSKVGQGGGAEYRYNYGAASNGTLYAHLLDTHESEYVQPNGTTTTAPGNRTFEIRGSANQMLPANIRARGNVSYFSDLTTMQTFNTNIADSSRTQRTFGANAVGAWSGYTMNATFDHTEYFYGTTSSALSGNSPRIAFARSERPLFGSNLYFSAGTEFVHLLRNNTNNSQETNTTLTRFDLAPQIRYPFKKWQWFTVNTAMSWRETFYTRSCPPAADPLTACAASNITDDSVNRRYYTVSAQAVGPVFMRIWDTPDNGYAVKFKHTIEPSLNVARTSSIDNYSQIVQLDGIDTIIGGSTQVAYGVANRLYAKRQLAPGQPALSREIVSVDFSQTYYTDPRAAQYDRQYATSFTGAPPSRRSPYALSVRAVPTDQISATLRAEFDSQYYSLRTISANGSYNLPGRVQASVGWSKKGFIPELSGFNDPERLDQYLNASANVHTTDNRVGTIYSFNYDLLRSALLQQRLSIFYNAQCCGLAFEYQTYNFAGISSPIPSDNRFFLSFTLAGLGNFSPFNGALGGTPR